MSGVSFFETMQGNMVDPQGHSHLVDFQIKAEATSLSHFLKTGKTRITGIVRAPPWTQEAVMEGELWISPIKQRGMVYQFSFLDDQERSIRFEGTKRIHLRHPIKTIATLHSKLIRDDVVLAEGALYFDLNELPELLASWRLQSDFASIDLAMSQDGPFLEPLNASQKRVLQAYAETVITPGTYVPPCDDHTVATAQATLATLPQSLQRTYRMALKTFDGLARSRKGRAFASLSPDSRWQVVEYVGRLGSTGRGLLMLLGFPIKSAHFNRRDYLDAIGVPSYDNPVRESPPDYMCQVNSPEELDEESDFEVDVVVVGSGAGGAPLAAELAESGYAVAILEQGKYYGRKDFSGAPMSRIQRFAEKGGMTWSVGNTVVSIPVGRMVGGTTAINSGTCFRTPGSVLETWRREHGLPEDFSEEGMERYFASVEDELRVGPGTQPYLGSIASLVARGAAAMGAKHAPLPRNAEGCDGQGTCAYGCPTDAKRATNVSYIPRALKAGAEIFTGMRVQRILMRGGRAVGVLARGQTPGGAPRRLSIRARAVVIACGSMGSPLLLEDNGLRLPWLGRNLSVHPAIGMFVRTDEPMNSWKTIPQGYGVKGLVDPRLTYEGFYLPPQIGAGLSAVNGPLLTEWMDAHGSVGQFGLMVKDQGVGSVSRSPTGGSLIRYSLTPETMDLMQRGAAALAELLIRGGGREVLACVGGVDVVRTVEEARAIGDLKLRASDFMTLAFHPLGTCRMGSGPDTAVVDSDHRVFGTENLYVVDGSVVPTSLGVNPQITIMSMALRAAERMKVNLGT